MGLLLLVVGEGLILARVRPLSDFYFPFVWMGYILLMDAAVYRQTGRSLYLHARRIFVAMFPISAVFWWVFELFNAAVHNWIYIGAEAYTGLLYVAAASLDFSFVLPAVWVSALFVHALLPRSLRSWPRSRFARTTSVGSWLLALEFGAGIVCLILPVLFPRYFFGLIWGCTFLLLDPINQRLGRPSMIAAVWQGRWHLPVSFALAALCCGFFWEAWNFWSMPKWIYSIPYVGFWHVFEMPLLGWLGYLPFGLELFAMTNFVFPLLRLGTLTLDAPDARPVELPSGSAAS